MRAATDFFVTDVDHDRLARMTEIAGLSSATIDECAVFLAVERRFPQCAWEAARRFAQHLVEGCEARQSSIACAFDDVRRWCNAAIAATAPLKESDPVKVAAAEAQRACALSMLRDHHVRSGFPSEGVMERMASCAAEAMRARDALFGTLGTDVPPWDELCARFLDAGRFDLLPRFADVIGRRLKLRCAERQFSLQAKSTTAAWQKSVFGTDDTDAIAGMMNARGVRYAGGIERAETRARVCEDDDGASLWLSFGAVDRLIHATAMPLYRVMEEAAREFEDAIEGIEGVLAKRDRVVLLTDHGFSENTEARGNAPRYRHDSDCTTDRLCAMLVFQRDDAPMPKSQGELSLS